MNKELIVFDTETTKKPLWKEKSDIPEQPHIVQLAAHVVDIDTREIKQSMNVIVRPEGWVITDETIEIHGITNEYAAEVGIPEKLAVEMFLALWDGRKRIAYNVPFDNRIIRIASLRYLGKEKSDAWKAGAYRTEWDCAMQTARRVMGKQAKLDEAYEYFTGEKLVNAHSAIADTDACLAVWFAAVDAETKAEAKI